jgi:hypothetical protein
MVLGQDCSHAVGKSHHVRPSNKADIRRRRPFWRHHMGRVRRSYESNCPALRDPLQVLFKGHQLRDRMTNGVCTGSPPATWLKKAIDLDEGEFRNRIVEGVDQAPVTEPEGCLYNPAHLNGKGARMNRRAFLSCSAQLLAAAQLAPRMFSENPMPENTLKS